MLHDCISMCGMAGIQVIYSNNYFVESDKMNFETP